MTMQLIYSKILEFVWHNFKRFAGVILIALIVLGVPYLAYRKGYNAGYKEMSEKCLAKPTYTAANMTVNNPIYASERKYLLNVDIPFIANLSFIQTGKAKK